MHWLACVLLFMSQAVAATEWRCDFSIQPDVVEKKATRGIENAFTANSYTDILKRLDKLLPTTTGQSKVAVYEAIAFANRTVQRFADVAAAYRSVYDMETASIRTREQARGNLATVLADLGRAKDVIDLYDDETRPLCGALSAEASYALVVANISVGNDAKAREIFDSAKVSASERFRSNLYLWNQWLLLRLRLDCLQKRWEHCGRDIEEFANMQLPEYPPIRQLNRLLRRLNSVPELQSTFAGLRQRGLVDDKGFIESRWFLTHSIRGVSCELPLAPLEARRTGTSGRVVLEFVIDGHGKTQHIEVLESSPTGMFEVVTLEAAWACKFSPNIIDGKPTPLIARRTYNFGPQPKTSPPR